MLMRRFLVNEKTGTPIIADTDKDIFIGKNRFYMGMYLIKKSGILYISSYDNQEHCDVLIQVKPERLSDVIHYEIDDDELDEVLDIINKNN
jgi:hypothetical protein